MPDVLQSNFIYKFAQKVFVVSEFQYNMICAHMAQYISFFLHTKKTNRSKTCCFTTGFEIVKNEEKKGGGG